MFARVLAVAFVATFSTAAYAQTSPSTSADSSTSATQQQSAQTLPQEIKDKLKQDGFSDIKIVPGSFLVSATDKSGEPVNMVIGPHSMFMVAEVGNQTQSGRASTGESNGTSQSNMNENNSSNSK